MNDRQITCNLTCICAEIIPVGSIVIFNFCTVCQFPYLQFFGLFTGVSTVNGRVEAENNDKSKDLEMCLRK